MSHIKTSVTFDNGITITKTRRKGKTTYTHSAFPTAWEKAEIPPEIKETLGLVKQQYGDFETCLNFAFQLDAPFMLSESASVGAKVLGKLAGTEIVDKSISEVNKKTHQTRNDISYADKQIGEIDVSLTEYFDLDRFDAELKIAEAAFTKLKEDQSRHVALTALMNSYQLNTEQRIKYYDEVERLAGVVVASVSLGIAEREQAKKEKLEDLNAGFWKAVQDQNEPLRVIRLTRNLEDLQTDLKEVETDVIRYDALLGFQYGYINLQETIRRTSALVVKLDQAVADKLRKAQNKLDAGVIPGGDNVLFSTWVMNWLEVIIKPGIKERTYINYKASIEKHIIPGIGRYKLKDITDDVIQKYLNDQQEHGNLKLEINDDTGKRHRPMDR